MRTIEEWKVKDWDQIEIDRAILFHKRKDPYKDTDLTGFDFKLVRWIEDDFTGNPKYELICHGYGLYDGVRHLYFGKDEEEPSGS